MRRLTVWQRIGVGLIIGIMAVGIILSTGDLGCPDYYQLADKYESGELKRQTCIGVEDGVVVTVPTRIVWR